VFAGSADRVGALQSRFEEQRKLTAMLAPQAKALAQTRSEQRYRGGALIDGIRQPPWSVNS
jgi:hypothetical protein